MLTLCRRESSPAGTPADATFWNLIGNADEDWNECDARFEVAKVEGRGPLAAGPDVVVLTDRGPVRAPLVVDALGWRRVLGSGAGGSQCRRA